MENLSMLNALHKNLLTQTKMFLWPYGVKSAATKRKVVDRYSEEALKNAFP